MVILAPVSVHVPCHVFQEGIFTLLTMKRMFSILADANQVGLLLAPQGFSSFLAMVHGPPER